MLHTDLGSDSDTIVEASSGNSVFSRDDRWVVTSDEAPFSDPPVSHVLFGKGKVARATNAVGAHQDVDGEGEECLFINFTVKLKPGQTRYRCSSSR